MRRRPDRSSRSARREFLTEAAALGAEAMPFDAPQSLRPEEVYTVSAFALYLNGIIGEDSVLDARTLPLVKMPNRGGFVPDPRPDAEKR